MSVFAAGDLCGDVWVDVSAGDSGGLDGVVDGVDMVTRGGDDGNGDAPRDARPHGAHCGEVIVECCGDDLVVGLVSVKSAGITASQLQRSGRLPRMGEPVQSFELLDTAVGAQLGEQASPADSLQLAMAQLAG